MRMTLAALAVLIACPTAACETRPTWQVEQFLRGQHSMEVIAERRAKARNARRPGTGYTQRLWAAGNVWALTLTKGRLSCIVTTGEGVRPYMRVMDAIRPGWRV